MRGRFTAEGCHSLPKTHQCFALYIPTHCALTTWPTAVLWVFTDEGGELEFRKLNQSILIKVWAGRYISTNLT